MSYHFLGSPIHVAEMGELSAVQQSNRQVCPIFLNSGWKQTSPGYFFDHSLFIKTSTISFYVHLYISSEHKNGDSMMLSIWDVQASNRDPAVTAAETGNQRSLGNDKRPEIRNRTKNTFVYYQGYTRPKALYFLIQGARKSNLRAWMRRFVRFLPEFQWPFLY